MTDLKLPELPNSYGDHCVTDSVRTMREPGFTADQLHAYARTAVELNTAQGEAVAWAEYVGGDLYELHVSFDDAEEGRRRNGGSVSPLYLHPPSADFRAVCEALRDLLQDTQHKNHDCGDEEWCPVIKAKAALALTSVRTAIGGKK